MPFLEVKDNLGFVQRREWDSNPRTGLARLRFSSPGVRSSCLNLPRNWLQPSIFYPETIPNSDQTHLESSFSVTFSVTGSTTAAIRGCQVDLSDLLNDAAELGRFRYAAAAVAKFLIRARIRHDPNFFTKVTLRDWHLQQTDREDRTDSQLLALSLRAAEELNRRYQFFCDSGGYSISPGWADEGIVGEAKASLAAFVDPVSDLPTAVKDAAAGRDLDWPQVANWNELPNLRRILNRLPHPPGGEPSGEKSGPDCAGNLWWEGDHAELEPVPFRLCIFLWGKVSVPVEKVIAEVWGETDLAMRPRALVSALSKLNGVMSALGIPWSYSQRNGVIIRE